MVVVWCALGMVVSFVSGAEFEWRKAQTTKGECRESIDLAQARAHEAEIRVEELRLRSADRDYMEQGLLECTRDRHKDFDLIADLRWQLEHTVATCPGRARPPRPPRF